MVLKQIVLKNFRNFTHARFTIHPSLTVVVGQNARGKTNLLESIFFIINGSGFRETKEIQLLKQNEQLGQVDGRFSFRGEETVFSIILQNTNNEITKAFFLDKTKRKYAQYKKDAISAVLFSPHQIELITGSPHLRRDYFDKLISFYDLEYKKKLVNYENALRQRNRLLAVIHDVARLKNEILFWNEYLEKQGRYLTICREQYVDFLNEHPTLDSKRFRIIYHKNELSLEKFQEYFEKEMRYKKTLIGPQKDDFEIMIDDQNVGVFGSRSEQRLAVIWLKMNEISFSEKHIHRKPILLLDDVFSEFDSTNKKLIFPLIKEYQTVLTTADLQLLEMLPKDHRVIELS